MVFKISVLESYMYEATLMFSTVTVHVHVKKHTTTQFCIFCRTNELVPMNNVSGSSKHKIPLYTKSHGN